MGCTHLLSVTLVSCREILDSVEYGGRIFMCAVESMPITLYDASPLKQHRYF
jgi:hypothetical protein